MLISRKHLTQADRIMGVTTYSCALCGGDCDGLGLSDIKHVRGCILAARSVTCVRVTVARAEPVVLRAICPGHYSWRSGVSGEVYRISRSSGSSFILVCASTDKLVFEGKLKEIRQFIADNQGTL